MISCIYWEPGQIQHNNSKQSVYHNKKLVRGSHNVNLKPCWILVILLMIVGCEVAPAAWIGHCFKLAPRCCTKILDSTTYSSISCTFVVPFQPVSIWHHFCTILLWLPRKGIVQLLCYCSQGTTMQYILFLFCRIRSIVLLDNLVACWALKMKHHCQHLTSAWTQSFV